MSLRAILRDTICFSFRCTVSLIDKYIEKLKNVDNGDFPLSFLLQNVFLQMRPIYSSLWWLSCCVLRCVLVVHSYVFSWRPAKFSCTSPYTIYLCLNRQNFFRRAEGVIQKGIVLYCLCFSCKLTPRWSAVALVKEGLRGLMDRIILALIRSCFQK